MVETTGKAGAQDNINAEIGTDIVSQYIGAVRSAASLHSSQTSVSHGNVFRCLLGETYE